MPLTRFGLQLPSFTLATDGEDDLFEKVADAALRAEMAGFDSVWVMDHFFQIPFVGDQREPMLEAYTTLGGIAARTSKVSLGTMVTGVTYRNPALLSKQVTALDVISGGRAVLGIGAAWFDSEHMALGFDFPPIAERFERLDEALQICRAMFTEDEPSFEGRYYRIDQALNRPRPVRPGGPPILVGGSGERRTLALVAKHADACNVFGGPETIKHKLEVLDRHCEAVGRDPGGVTRTRLGTLILAETDSDAEERARGMATRRGLPVDPPWEQITFGGPERVLDEVASLFDAGLDGLVFNMPDVWEPGAIERVDELVISAFGSKADATALT
jgi:F420-dependent oxidoreductase-like protein